jgi:hypothetical protein
VTDERLPAVVDNAGIHPLDVMLPEASFNCTVMVDVLTPFAIIGDADAEINVWVVVATENFTELLGKLLHAPLLTVLLK